MKIFIKPDLRFFCSKNPAIGVLIQWDYNKANSYEDIAGLIHKWFGRADKCIDDSDRHVYERSAKCLFSILTNKSYESKISI